MFASSQVLARTVDIHCDGLDQITGLLAAGLPVLALGWHAQVTPVLGALPRLLPGREIAIMTLVSWRGRMLARYASRFGLRVEPLGDRPLDRLQTAARLIEHMRAGHLGLLAADGPDGPAGQVKEAIVSLAQRAGALLVPCALASDRYLTLPWRWDRAFVPLPGARLQFQVGQPLEATGPAVVAELQRALLEVNHAARSALAWHLKSNAIA